MAPCGAKVSLPAKAADRAERQAEIAKRRKQLGYNYETIPKLALGKGLPKFIELSDEYTMERTGRAKDVIENQMFIQGRRMFDVVNNMEDYEDYFFKLKAPELVQGNKWMTDDFFAEQRISGANPLKMRVLERDDPRVEILSNVDVDFNLKSELAAKNIYVCDYSGTDPTYRGPVMVAGGTSHSGKAKWLPKPIAFFHWVEEKGNKETGGKMEPVCIQVDASLDPVEFKFKTSKIYTPKEEHPNNWMFAKICTQVADSLHHEMSSHLARCHFTIEPIAVAVHRTMAEEHPIALLLNTHLRFHISNDAVAAYTLISDSEHAQANVKDLMPGTLRETMALLTEAYDKWDLIGMNFKNDLYERDVANEDRLPHYPYRDDGNLIWDAIEEWCERYVKEVYNSDDEVAADEELQDWAAECANQESGGKVKGMPLTITKRSVLVEILCSIIFVCGPGHGAINFAQYENMAFTPNMPLAMYQDVQLMCDQTKDSKTPITDEQLMAMLPDAEHAQRQLFIIENLTNYKFDKFGDYNRTFQEWYKKDFDDYMKDNGYGDIAKAHHDFRKRLEKCGKEINKRNEKRPVQYVYMHPEEMLNSISI